MIGRVPKPLLLTVALLFAATALLYAVLWTLYASRGVAVELGFDDDFDAAQRNDRVINVKAGSPAERAGLKAGDRILAADGVPLNSQQSLPRIWSRHHPGDNIELQVLRPGSSSPIILHGTFRLSESGRAEEGVVGSIHLGVFSIYPFIYIVVGFAVLFLRLEDSNAWLLALLFAAFTAIPGLSGADALPRGLGIFIITYRTIFDSILPAAFYYLFAVFPEPSPIERRVPWLKWLAVIYVLGFAVLQLPMDLNYASAYPKWLLSPRLHVVLLSFNYTLLGLGFLSLIWNDRVASAEARRKTRVILWGTLVGVVPPTIALFANQFFHFTISVPLGSALVVLLWLFPLSFAYAVVKHRVLGIPVLLRRGARYLLVQRGFAILLVGVSIAVTAGFALVFSRYLQSLTDAAVPGGIGLASVFGSVLLWTGLQVHKDVGRRIDRAFFRSAYDTRLVMEDLLAKLRTATTREELATLVEYHLKEALQPSSGAMFLESPEGQLVFVRGSASMAGATFSPADHAFRELAKHNKPLDLFSDPEKAATLPGALLLFAPECLVPIPGRDERLAGMIVLSARLSEEPYSSEDKHLLTLIANQVGVAVDSILLAEKIAERMEAERRTQQELEFAREVQARLLPQILPPMKTLEYGGGCVPARKVGGDYYDFLELRPGRLGIVLADIAGKGIAGALLMANLQANLRSQYAMALEDLPGLLASVNRLFFQNTEQNSYATLFFADYHDATHLLRYVNCGHLPALLLRAGGNPQSCEPVWLSSTCTVLGLFENLAIEVAEVKLAAGDTLVLYTDGVTETENAGGEEFGESRLVEVVRGQCRRSASEILQSVFQQVANFSPGEQQDDVTLVVARCTA